MKNPEGTLHTLFFLTALALSASAMTSPARAAVSVQIEVPGIIVDARDPYYYSPVYCAGCWYGQWGGRTGYHRGGGRPWEREHFEAHHHGHEHGRDVRHEGHR